MDLSPEPTTTGRAAPVTPGWQEQLGVQRDQLNARLAAARAAGASPDQLRAALLEVGPAADHLARIITDPDAFARAVPVLVDAVARLVERRAWHESSAERWALLGVVPFLPRAMTRSPETTVEVVVHGASKVARGADLGAWGHRLAAADAYLVDDDALRGAAAVAAWRSGFVRVRAAALHAATTLPDDALVALLDLDRSRIDAAGRGDDSGSFDGSGITDGELTGVAGRAGSAIREVLARHAADPFWWPGEAAAACRARVGGFRGDGGPWVGVPVVLDAHPASTPTWRVAADDQLWVVVADVHGSAVLREPGGAGGSGATTVADLVAALRPDAALVAAVSPSLGSDDTITGAVPAAVSPAGSAGAAPTGTVTQRAAVVLVSQQSSYRLSLVVPPTGASR